MHRLYPPFYKAKITQPFTGNANTFYANNELAGHPGIDYELQEHKTVLAAQQGQIYKVLNRDNPDKSRYRAVFQLVYDGFGNWYELVYGHLDKIFVTPGEYVIPFVPLGTEGNTGAVYRWGNLVTEAQRELGWGRHLHFQKRPVIRTRTVTPGEQYLEDASGRMYFDKEGFCYWVKNYKNGFNGCVDPGPDIQPPSITEGIRLRWDAYWWLMHNKKVAT